MDRKLLISAILAAALGLGVGPGLAGPAPFGAMPGPPGAQPQTVDCRPGDRDCRPPPREQRRTERPRDDRQQRQNRRQDQLGGADNDRGVPPGMQRQYDQRKYGLKPYRGLDPWPQQRQDNRRPPHQQFGERDNRPGDRDYRDGRLRGSDLDYLPRAPRGSEYRIARGKLYLIDRDTGRILRNLGDPGRWLR